MLRKGADTFREVYAPEDDWCAPYKDHRMNSHAWGAHPLYHYFAAILGIRPAAPGFRTIEGRPQLGPLGKASGTLPHPLGAITAEFRREGEGLTGCMSLPEGIAGILTWQGVTRPISSGPVRL